MSYPVKIDLPDLIRGDGWPGINIGPVTVGETVNSAAVPDEVLQRVEVVLWGINDNSVQHRYDSDEVDSGVVITDNLTWTATVEVDSTVITPGIYNWAARFSADGWGPYTLYEGRVEVLNIIPDPIV